MSGDIKGRTRQRIKYKIPSEHSIRRKRRKRKRLLFAIGVVLVLIIIFIWVNHNMGIKNAEENIEIPVEE